MASYGSNQKIHEKIGELLNKLNNGQSDISDVEELLTQSREFYERILVLRFKAFEGTVREINNEILVPQIEIESPKIEEIVVPDEAPSIEFALFGELTDVPNTPPSAPMFSEPEKSKVSKVDAYTVESIEVEQNVKKEPIKQVQNNAVEQHASPSLLDKLSSNSPGSSLGDQLKKSHIDSILSALTLNDRIRFTKNLFDGNSDTFNAAIQLLDAQKSLIAARELLAEYNTRYEWVADDKNAIDFNEFIERRYA